MHLLSLTRALPLLVLALLSGTTAAQQVHVVGPLADPAADFHDIQQAIDAASDGDILLLQPDFSGGHGVIVDKSLVLAGLQDGLAVPYLESLAVLGLASHRSVVVRGLDIYPFFGESLSVSDCAGSVLFEDCRTSAFFASLSPTPSVVRSPRVVFAHCVLTGGKGQSTGSALTPGDAALDISDSSVSLLDCQVVGGEGGPAVAQSGPFEVDSPGTAGGAGVSLSNGTLVLAGTSVHGGKGGNGVKNLSGDCLAPADGGVGLVLDGLLRRIDSSVLGGAAGALGTACSGAGASAGADLVVLGGSVQDIPQVPGRLTVSSPVEEGGLCTIDITAGPRQPVLLLQSLAPLGQWLGGLKGTLAGAAPLTVFALGFTDATAQLHFDLTLPANVLPPGTEGLLLVDQLVTPAAGGGGLLSSPSAVVLVQQLP